MELRECRALLVPCLVLRLLLLLRLLDAANGVLAYSFRFSAAPASGVIGHNTVTGAASASSAVRMAMTAETKKVKDLTLVFCRRVADCGTKEILLGKKKRGFGLGKWNGFGGKVEAGETIEAAAQRELLEESFVTARHLSLRGVLTFNVPSNPTTMRVFVYEAVEYSGEPSESEEMRPQWFNEAQLPHKRDGTGCFERCFVTLGSAAHVAANNIPKEMWADDAYWMPLFLSGKFFRGEFDYEDEEVIVRHSLRELPSVDALHA